MAAPAQAVPLQPVSPWSVDYGTTQCAAARTFGSASAPVRLSIVPSVSGGTYMLQVTEQEEGPRFAQELGGSVDFGTGPITSNALYFGGNGAKMRAHQFRITATQMEYARTAGAVSLRETRGASFDFALADMPSLLDALRKCTADLQQSWNVSAAVKTDVKPVGDVRAIFTSNDLPAAAMQKQQPERARYQLFVDEKGAVAGCDVLVPGGSALIDTEGCQLLSERAKFKPAADAAGKAVRRVWTSPPVTWRTNQETFDNGCRSVTGGGPDANMCGQSATQRMMDNSGYGGGAPRPQ